MVHTHRERGVLFYTFHSFHLFIYFSIQGDGGAPLVCPIGRLSDNRYAQNGIVAWGIDCKKAYPAVYANVALARDWIDGQIRFIGLDTSYYTYRN